MLTTSLPAHVFPLISCLSEVHPQKILQGGHECTGLPESFCAQTSSSQPSFSTSAPFSFGAEDSCHVGLFCASRVLAAAAHCPPVPAALQPPGTTTENVLCEEGGDGIPVPQPEDLRDSCWHVLSLSSFVSLNCSLLLKSLTRVLFLILINNFDFIFWPGSLEDFLCVFEF